MRTISASKLSAVAMVGGGERRIHKVVDHGRLMEWVGIGWIDLRRATKADRLKYPKVTHES